MKKFKRIIAVILITFFGIRAPLFAGLDGSERFVFTSGIAYSSLTWNAVDSAMSPHLTWRESLSSYANMSTHDNQVLEMGHNISPGGGLINSAYSGIRDAWEGYYEPVMAGQGYHERHLSIVPLNVATAGEIRMLSFMARANVNRDAVEPFAGFQSTWVSFTHPSTAGIINGDSVRIGISGAPNFDGQLTFNNGYGKIRRGGVSKGSNYPLLEQINAAGNGSLSAMYWKVGSDAMYLNLNNAGGLNEVNIGELSQPGALIVNGLSSPNSRAFFSLHDKFGSDGDYQSFIGHNATTLFFGAPQAALTNYNDATISSGAGLALTNVGNVGIGTPSPNANAILDLTSITKAFMPPRMTTAQMNAIPNPTAGMVIYNLSFNVLYFYNGIAWGAV